MVVLVEALWARKAVHVPSMSFPVVIFLFRMVRVINLPPGGQPSLPGDDATLEA